MAGVSHPGELIGAYLHDRGTAHSWRARHRDGSGFRLGQMMSGPDIMRSADAAMLAQEFPTATNAEPQFADGLGEFDLLISRPTTARQGSSVQPECAFGELIAFPPVERAVAPTEVHDAGLALQRPGDFARCITHCVLSLGFRDNRNDVARLAVLLPSRHDQADRALVRLLLKLGWRAGLTPAEARPEVAEDRKSTRLNSSHPQLSRMPSSA